MGASTGSVEDAKPIVAKPGFPFDSPASLWAVRASDLAFEKNTQAGRVGEAGGSSERDDNAEQSHRVSESNQQIFGDADGTELRLQSADIPDLQRQVSQELTVVQRLPKLTWIGGAFLFDEQTEARIEITVYPSIQIRPFPTVFGANARALFGQATYDVSRRVSLTAGARYTTERKDFQSLEGVYLFGTDILADPSSFHEMSAAPPSRPGRRKAAFSCRYQTTRSSTYPQRKASRAADSIRAPRVPGLAYDPESAWSYEGGIKRTIAGGRARVNMAAFYSDYQDLQVQSFIRAGVPDISNAASATIKGVEVEVAASAWRGVQLAGHLSWLDATYIGYLAVGPEGATGDAAGNRLNSAARMVRQQFRRVRVRDRS